MYQRYVPRAFPTYPYNPPVRKLFTKGSGRPELKYNYETDGFIPLSTGQYQLLNGIAQGSQADERIGNRITIKSILLSLNVGYKQPDTPSTTWSIPPQTVRFILLWDKQNNGITTAPVASQFLQDASNPIVSGVRDVEKHRFHILWDYHVPLSGVLNSSGAPYTLLTGSEPKFIRKYIKCNFDVNYENTGDTQGNIKDSTLWLYSFTDSPIAIGTNGAAYIDMYTKVRFVDP